MADNNSWTNFKIQLYTSRKAPDPLGTVSFEEIEQKAREALKDNIGMYRSLIKGIIKKHTE